MDKWLDEAVAKMAVNARRKGLKVPKTGVDRAQAERMAADLDAYDSQIVGGRLT